MRNKASELEVGFGFRPAESAHHFALILCGIDEGSPVVIEERYTYGEVAEPRSAEARAEIDRYSWNRLAEAVQSHFNRRLKDAGRRISGVREGENLLAPYLGKELVLLFWALAGIDPTDLPNALANWQGFVPEERWWLYATARASGAGPADNERGWRKAIRIAFAESPAPPPADSGLGLAPKQQPLPVPEPEPVEKPTRPPRHIKGARSAGPSLFD